MKNVEVEATTLLEHHLCKVIFETGSEPSIIVVHPDTFEELILCKLKLSGIGYAQHLLFRVSLGKYKLTYRGIRILRSLDVEPGTFES